MKGFDPVSHFIEPSMVSPTTVPIILVSLLISPDSFPFCLGKVKVIMFPSCVHVPLYIAIGSNSVLVRASQVTVLPTNMNLLKSPSVGVAVQIESARLGTSAIFC